MEMVTDIGMSELSWQREKKRSEGTMENVECWPSRSRSFKACRLYCRLFHDHLNKLAEVLTPAHRYLRIPEVSKPRGYLRI